MRRAVIAKVLLASMLLLPVGTGASLLTQSEDFTKAVTYGLNVATYTAEKKSGKEAAQKLMGYDVLWDLLGKGEEALLNGDPDAIPTLKDNFLKVKLVLDKTAEIADRIGRGELTEGAISSIDTAVGLLNHPVVNAMWEAIKLTYQSQKAVESTGAALQIETLYGIVDRDRRLFGVSSGNGPRLIQVNSGTADYFFNKYLITNASTRALVKTYVEKVLGEEFPTLPTGQRIFAMLTFTSDAAKEEQELRKLEEFKNTSRRWIVALLKDLNKQASLVWARTRAMQQREKFQAFYKRAGKAFANIDEALAYFTNMARIRKEYKTYPAKLKAMQVALEKARKELPSLSAAQVDRRLQLRNQVLQLGKKSHAYAVNALIIDKFDLRAKFEDFQRDCMKFVIRVDALLEHEKEQMMTVLMEPEATEDASHTKPGAHDYPNPGDFGEVDTWDYEAQWSAFAKNMLSLFEPVLSAQRRVLDEMPMPPLEEVETHLANYEGLAAIKVRNKWILRGDQLLSKASHAVDEANRRVSKSSIGDVPCYEPNRERTPCVESVRQAILNAFWGYAHDKTKKAMRAQQQIFSIRIEEGRSRMDATLRYYWKTLGTTLRTAVDNLQILRDLQDRARTISLDSHLKYANRYLSEHGYTTLGRIKVSDPATIHLDRIGAFLRAQAEDIGGAVSPMAKLEHLVDSFSDAGVQIARLDSLQKDLKGFIPLEPETISLVNAYLMQSVDAAQTDWSLDAGPVAIPSGLGISQARTDTVYLKKLMELMTGSTTEPLDYTGLLNKLKDRVAPLSGSVLKEHVRQFTLKAETDIENRQKDMNYLAGLERQYQAWFDRQKRLGRVSFEPETGMWIWGHRLRTRDGGYCILDKPYRHAATAQDFIADPDLSTGRSELEGLPVYAYFRKMAPEIHHYLEQQFTGGGVVLAKEANFVVGQIPPVWQSDIEKGEQIVGSIRIDSPDFTKKLHQLAKLFPFYLQFPKKDAGHVTDLTARIFSVVGKDPTFNLGLVKGGKLGNRFVAMAKKIQALRKAKANAMLKAQHKALEDNGAAQRLSGYRKELAKLMAQVEEISVMSGDQGAVIHDLYQRYWDLLTRYNVDKLAQDPDFTRKLLGYDHTFADLEKRKEQRVPDQTGKVRQLYQAFASAYSNRDEAGVIALIDPGWEAVDSDTDITDLEDTLANSFDVFDEVRYEQKNLLISPQGKGDFEVSYDLTIRGEIYDDELVHEEKSRVTEKVHCAAGGRCQIVRTRGGRFWVK